MNKFKQYLFVTCSGCKVAVFSSFMAFCLVLTVGCSKNEPEKTMPFPKTVTSLAIDENNTKWIGTVEGLYQSIAGGYQIIDSNEIDSVYSVYYESSNNLLWVSSLNGLYKMQLTGTNATEHSLIPSENLRYKKVLTTYIDSSLNRWFGRDIGISLNVGDEWKNDSFRINRVGKMFLMDLEKEDLNMAVNSIASWDGDYFFATSGGYLYRATEFVDSVDAFSGATQWIPPYNGQNLTTNMYVVFVDSKGNQWMGGENGIQVHKGHEPKSPEDFTSYTTELVDLRIHAIAEAPNGDIWVGTEGGISVFNGSSWSSITNGLPDLYVTAIAFDKTNGSAWIGTKKGLVNFK